VCTKPCERASSCADLDDDAVCLASTPPACAEAQQICARAAVGTPSQDGSVATQDGATPASDGGSEALCRRMDARSNGDGCLSIEGFAWNGLSCEAVVCGCAGADCGGLFEDETACEDAHGSCAPLTMCTGPSDCALNTVDCCKCEVTPRDLASVAMQSNADFTARTCSADSPCTICGAERFGALRDRYLPACVPSTRWEGGECTLMDLAQLPCTPSAGCRVRSRECCECNASTATEALIAVPNGGDTTWFNAVCEPEQACADCETVYPANLEARCGEAGFCELLEDGVVVAP
jgi:hypothetical protein